MKRKRSLEYTCTYKSELGNILLAADEIGLTGLWFEGQKYFANTLPEEHISQETPILTDAKKWLDIYFSGEEPKFTPSLHPTGSAFRQAVWQIPCHRVVGTNGSLTGYAGGIDKKIALLNLEHTDMSHFFVPKKGTRSRRDEKGKNTD